MKFSNILVEMDTNIAKYSNDEILRLLKKMDHGSIQIEFMGQGKDIQLVVKFNEIGWLLNSNSTKQVVYFKSITEFISSVKKSVDNIYGSDLKAVYREVFDPKEMEDIFRQISFYSKEYPEKAKSLAFQNKDAVNGEKNTNWDMEIKFRRSTEKMSKNEGWKIYPILTGSGNVGKIIEPIEKEVEWDEKKLNKFISNLQ